LNKVEADLAAYRPIWICALLADISNVGVWIDEVRGQWAQFAQETGGEVLLQQSCRLENLCLRHAGRAILRIISTRATFVLMMAIVD